MVKHVLSKYLQDQKEIGSLLLCNKSARLFIDMGTYGPFGDFGNYKSYSKISNTQLYKMA